MRAECGPARSDRGTGRGILAPGRRVVPPGAHDRRDAQHDLGPNGKYRDGS